MSDFDRTFLLFYRADRRINKVSKTLIPARIWLQPMTAAFTTTAEPCTTTCLRRAARAWTFLATLGRNWVQRYRLLTGVEWVPVENILKRAGAVVISYHDG